ncbi:MAG: hypothetical protein R3181_09260 [Rubricoccaceae bacterium]|nr:hypothetical protein [Rubricoccaceae bacterium]
MLNTLSRRRAQPRRFSYEPRFYDPKKDERLKRRMRVERNRARPKTKQPHFIAVGLGLVAALYLYLNIDEVVAGAAALGGALFGG